MLRFPFSSTLAVASNEHFEVSFDVQLGNSMVCYTLVPSFVLKPQRIIALTILMFLFIHKTFFVGSV
jgi:hypothetical protein